MTKRVNVGCGRGPLKGWINLEADPAIPADIHATVPPMPFADDELDEIYLGHLLEHLTPKDAHGLLVECRRALKPGGRLGVVVPDTREIAKRYLQRSSDTVPYQVAEGARPVEFPVADLDAICALWFYSTVQDSPHRWSYDMDTLARAILRAGFVELTPIDRYADPRIAVHVWYGCGYDARKPGGAA